tara:strand:+ start:1327 stop:1926 length:600 start_codon:yes stop_codon:yes gene_type:complete
MTSDRRPHRTQKAAKASRPGFLFIVLAFCVGYVTASIWGWQDIQSMLKTKLVLNQKTSDAAFEPALPKPKFEFYTLLSEDSSTSKVKKKPPLKADFEKKTSSVPVEAANPVKTGSTKPPSTSAYLVQVASFRNPADADRMKADLILKDFKAVITHIKKDRQDWFRVMVGPYHSRIEAEKAQVLIAKSEHVMGMIRRMDA